MKRFFLLLFLAFPGLIHAQNISSGVAQYIQLGSDAQDSMIVCTTETGSSICNRDSDPNMIGVISLTPAASFGVATPNPGTLPVISNGKAYVLVSGQNGPIKVGDFITSSTTPGIAVKAIKSGYVLGVAANDFAGTTTQQTGKILVAISVRPAVLSTKAGNNLVEMIRQGMESAFLTPLSAIRYVIAGIITIFSIIIGISNFGKSAKAGIEAIGRNPLASRAIQLSILLNVALNMGIVTTGILIAYLILSL